MLIKLHTYRNERFCGEDSSDHDIEYFDSFEELKEYLDYPYNFYSLDWMKISFEDLVEKLKEKKEYNESLSGPCGDWYRSATFYLEGEE